MTKRIGDCTPEQAEKLRASVRRYKEKNKPRLAAQAAERHKFRYENDPEYRARKDRQANECRMRKRYGIGPRERDQILAEQGGRCAICQTNTPGGRGWHVDHCHSSGKVRKILCTACNVFVGRIEKNPMIHERALKYILDHRDAND